MENYYIKALAYTVGRYGDRQVAERIATMDGVPFDEFCARFYRDSTGDGETRDPRTLTAEEYTHYTPLINRKAKESVTDYRLRQLDYWFKHCPS